MAVGLRVGAFVGAFVGALVGGSVGADAVTPVKTDGGLAASFSLL